MGTSVEGESIDTHTYIECAWHRVCIECGGQYDDHARKSAICIYPSEFHVTCPANR